MEGKFASLIEFIWIFCKRRWRPLFGLVIVGILWAIHACLSPVLVKEIIDSVASSSFKNVSNAVRPFTYYVLLTLLLMVIRSWYDYLYIQAFVFMRTDIIEFLHQRLIRYPYSFFQRYLSGSIASKIGDLSGGVPTILTMLIDDLFSRPLLFVIGLVTLYYTHPLFAISLFIWAFSFFVLSYFLSKKSLTQSALFSEARSRVIGYIVDCFSNIFTIKIFRSLSYETGFLRSTLTDLSKKEYIMRRYRFRLKLVQGFFITFLMVFMICLLFYAHHQGWITVGDFALVLMLTTSLVDETFFLAQQMVFWTLEVGYARQALSLFLEPVNPEKQIPERLILSNGEVIFDHVSFFYTPQKPIFQNLYLAIQPQEKVGIVGLSGSGKSTLVHLLLRLYEVTAGKILIDGQNIAEFSYHLPISMIPQEVHLFSRTIYENIVYGRPHALYQEVIEASSKARCDDFISALPQGYDTVVGEKGVKLSGGQKQRVAIARAFLRNDPILILDEATSALDAITEKQIQDSLHELWQGKTVIAIAHRLSTLLSMNRILVFENGKLIEEGTHEELVKKSGRYEQLWSLQT